MFVKNNVSYDRYSENDNVGEMPGLPFIPTSAYDEFYAMDDNPVLRKSLPKPKK